MSSEVWIRRVAFFAVAGLVTAACGSTVPATQQEAAEEAAAEGLDLSGGGAGGGGLGGGGDLGGGLSGGTTGSGGTAAGGSPPAAPRGDPRAISAARPPGGAREAAALPLRA